MKPEIKINEFDRALFSREGLISSEWQDAQDRLLEYIRRMGIGAPDSLKVALEAISRAGAGRGVDGGPISESIKELRRVIGESKVAGGWGLFDRPAPLRNGCPASRRGETGPAGIMVVPPLNRGVMACADLGVASSARSGAVEAEPIGG